jgi:hypothetical protein
MEMIKGELIYNNQEWFVSYEEVCSDEQHGHAITIRPRLPLHPNDVKQFKLDSSIFDNFEARVLANPIIFFVKTKIGNIEYANLT